MRKAGMWYILVSLLLTLGSIGAYAQANSQLTGIVTDQTGAMVPGATVTLTDPATGLTKETISESSGLYVIGGLNPATYHLKISAKGFQTFEQTGVVINVSSTLRVDAKLTVGAESQTVTVSASALAVQTDSNVVSSLISSEQISSIATQNRNFAALAALGLGVSNSMPDSNTPTSVAANWSFSVNGLRQSHNIWLIDGGESDDRGAGGGMAIMPSQDAIAEFNVMTSNYPPDYGISSGATMSLSLKSGTQKFHGTLWEFNRTPAYNAKEPISRTLTNLHYNIFGGNIGGPIFIPHVYNENRQKTFFFVNEEWRKIINPAGTSNSPTIPNADRPVAGQDLHYVAPGFAPSTKIVVPVVGDAAFNARLTALGLTPGQPFPNNTIPSQLFDPNAVLFLGTGIVPKPTTSDDKAVANAANPIDVRDDIIRADHRFNDKWAILGHYMHDTVTQTYGVPFLGWLSASYNTVTSNLANPAYSAAIKLSGTINPNLLVEASINYDSNIIDITNSDLANKPSGWNAGTFFDNGSKLVPGMGWGTPYNVNEQQGSAPWHNAAQDYMPKGDVSYTKGKHALKFGVSYNRYTKNQQLFGNVMGQYQFSANLSGDAFMDMVMGLPNTYQQFMEAPIRHYVNQTPSVYVMDNWHVTPRFTLQLGLRYDALPHAWERQDYVANFTSSMYQSTMSPKWNSDGSMDPNGPGFQVVNDIPYYLNGMGLAGQTGFPHGLVKNDYQTLQPRIGFSEDLTGNGKTVLRGGFGTFFERMQGNDIYNTATAPPFAYNPNANNVYFSTPSKSWTTGAEASKPFFPAGIQNMPQTYRAPAVAMFSVGLQREVAPSMIFVAQYIGNIAWHQNVQRNINTFPLTTDLTVRCHAGDGSNKYNGGTDVCPDGLPPANLANTNFYRTYPGWAGINQQENTTNGNYNAFQTALRIQNRWGLSGEVDYTWSHEIDITSTELVGVSNPWNLKYDKGSGQFDRRHILSINYVYHMPFFNSSSNGWTKSLLGGWQFAGTVLDQSGVIPNAAGPGMSISYDPVGMGGGYTNRPNQTAKTHYLKQRNKWFDTSTFAAPVPVWLGGPNMGFGNARKDAIVGPGRVNFNTSLYKTFAIREAAQFELRFESFNTFNHFQPNALNTSYNGSQFGQITSAWDPRTLELGGKFTF